MDGYRPTDMAIELATMTRDEEFIRAEIEDDALNDRFLDYETAAEGTTVEKMDADESPEDKQELLEAIEQIPIDPNDEYEEVMKIVQSTKPKISIDEVMGLGSMEDDAAVVNELIQVANEE